METQFERTELLLGEQAMKKLFSAHVAVFGVGGVGSFAVEALARSGVGTLSVFDGDVVCLSNINRQLIATHKTIGMPKAEVMKQRILDINPNAVVNAYEFFYTKENADTLDYTQFDYIVDAIDTVSSKILLVEKAKAFGVPVMSSMGAGKKLNPTGFIVSDIYETSVCPLAKVMRKELRSRGIEKLKVVYSKEVGRGMETERSRPFPTNEPSVSDNAGAGLSRPPIGSVAFVPSVAGLIIAGEVIKDIVSIK